MQALQVNTVLACSEANGPGRRMVIWFQGCYLRCPGCFNLDMQRIDLGNDLSVETLLAMLDSAVGSWGVEGVTLSGGEPLLQTGLLLDFVKGVAERKLSIILLSGYTARQILTDPAKGLVVSYCDVLIAGPYQEDQRVAKGLIGSANKQLVFLTNLYDRKDLEAVPQCEVKIGKDGQIKVTGISPMELNDA